MCSIGATLLNTITIIIDIIDSCSMCGLGCINLMSFDSLVVVASEPEPINVDTTSQTNLRSYYRTRSTHSLVAAKPEPKPINVDTTSQKNVRRDYRARSTTVTENIISQPTEGVGSEPIHINIVESSKIKEHRNKNFKIRTLKENVESGKPVDNKDKQETIPIDSTGVRRMKRKGSTRTTPIKDNKKLVEASVQWKKPRSLNELLMESMSGSKRDNEKVEIGMDMEDKEDVVKRKKGSE
ncbi:unnamed protein product [Lactuca saligna]|uniref:Uncharacterized protein n=1 Tax=Lactuca saligna TaxID=75948 RepID=A0AA35Z3Y3_LACSI|nr:unnamed protein product [Lactuca saligna]